MTNSKRANLSWNKAKEIIQATLKAPVGREKETLENALANAQRTQSPAPYLPLGYRAHCKGH